MKKICLMLILSVVLAFTVNAKKKDDYSKQAKKIRYSNTGITNKNYTARGFKEIKRRQHQICFR